MITQSARRLGTVQAADDGSYTFSPADVTEDPAPSRRTLAAACADAATFARHLTAATEEPTMPEHRVSVDASLESATPGPDQAYAAFCDSPDCLWRGDWHHADEYADGDSDGDTAAYLAADDDAAQHRLDTRGTGGPVVHVPTVGTA